MEFASFPYLTAILLSCVIGLLIILFLPDEKKQAIKQVSAVFSGLTLALVAHRLLHVRHGPGGAAVRRADPLGAVARHQLLQCRRRVQPAHDPADRDRLLHRGAHHAGARTPGEGVLCALLPARHRGLRALHELRPVLHLHLVRRVPLPHVPADRRVGQHAQGVRRDEAHPVPARGQRAHPAGDRLPARGGGGHELRHHHPHAAGDLLPVPAEARLPAAVSSASASWPPSGRSTPGRRSATWPPPPR